MPGTRLRRGAPCNRLPARRPRGTRRPPHPRAVPCRARCSAAGNRPKQAPDVGAVQNAPGLAFVAVVAVAVDLNAVVVLVRGAVAAAAPAVALVVAVDVVMAWD